MDSCLIFIVDSPFYTVRMDSDDDGRKKKFYWIRHDVRKNMVQHLQHEWVGRRIRTKVCKKLRCGSVQVFRIGVK